MIGKIFCVHLLTDYLLSGLQIVGPACILDNNTTTVLKTAIRTYSVGKNFFVNPLFHGGRRGGGWGEVITPFLVGVLSYHPFKA